MQITAVSLVLFIFAPFVAWGAVSINEIAWMGTAADHRDEWIELKNDATDDVDITEWLLIIEGQKEISLQGAVPAGGFFVLRRPDEANPSEVPTDMFSSFGKGGLTNSGETVILKNASGSEIDRVDGSDAWSIGADGAPAGDNGTKETAQRTAGGWVTALPTPRADNSSVMPGEADPPEAAPETDISESEVAPAPSGGSVVPPVFPEMHAYAGDDKTTTVGSFVEFMGRATGIADKPLENARFWWNFGDGSTKEGRAVSHIFSIPGIYTVGLHVSSAGYAASDYVEVRITPNKVIIEEVEVGLNGFIRVQNEGVIFTDIGGWVLGDGKNTFFVPPKTKISAGASVAFLNSVTGLNPASAVFASYPNGAIAFEYKREESEENEQPLRVVVTTPSVAAAQPIVPIAKITEPQPISQTPRLSEELIEGDEESHMFIEEETLENQKHTRALVGFDPTQNTFLGIAAVLSALSALGFLLVRWFERIHEVNKDIE